MDTQRVLIPVVCCCCVTLTTLLWLYYYKKKALPTEWRPVGRVTALYLYPLKSGRGLEMEQVECTRFGVRQLSDQPVYKLRDRFLIVYNEKNMEFRTARTHPKMILMEIANHDSNHIAIDAPDMRSLYVKIPPPQQTTLPLICTMHSGEKTEMFDCGDEAATWLSRYIIQKESGLRLGYHDDTMNTRIAPKLLQKFNPNLTNKDLGMFSDLSGYLLINKQSVDDLNTRLESKVELRQFRPNIVVDEINQQPYVENGWKWIRIGQDTIFRNVSPCTRCILTTIDINTGIMDTKQEPLKTLKTYRQLENEEARKASGNSPVLGANLGVRREGIIQIGDIVYIAE